jgi:hypothetical protein
LPDPSIPIASLRSVLVAELALNHVPVILEERDVGSSDMSMQSSRLQFQGHPSH